MTSVELHVITNKFLRLSGADQFSFHGGSMLCIYSLLIATADKKNIPRVIIIKVKVKEKKKPLLIVQLFFPNTP